MIASLVVVTKGVESSIVVEASSASLGSPPSIEELPATVESTAAAATVPVSRWNTCPSLGDRGGQLEYFEGWRAGVGCNPSCLYYDAMTHVSGGGVSIPASLHYRSG